MYKQIILSIFFLYSSLFSERIENVQAKASVAILGMNAEEAQQLALRRVRAKAIEKANGLEITSTTLIKDGALAMDFLKSYTNGIIINEKVTWLPMSTYQKNATQAPIPEYNIHILADIKIVNKKTDLVLFAELNKDIFIDGDLLELSFISSDDAYIAIFYLGLNDTIYRLVPELDERLLVKEKNKFIYPSKNSNDEFIMQSLKNHKKTTEALWVLATKKDSSVDFSKQFLKEKYSLSEFSEIYADIASECIEKILPYIILNK